MMGKAQMVAQDASRAFKVIPEVFIHDRSLQMLNLMLKGAIFFYIVVWSIAIQKNYLQCYEAAGTSKLHAQRLKAATDAQCASIDMPRTAGHEHDGQYYSTDEWCEQWPAYTRDFAPVNPHGRRRVQTDSESWSCYKRGTGELELAYDQVGTELPSGFNTLSYRFKYGVTPQFGGTRQAAYDTESYVLYFNDLLLSRPYITGRTVMVDDTLGGNQHEISYSLEDEDGNVIDTCTNANKDTFDWRDTCGAGPFSEVCEFTSDETLVLPIRSLLEAAGVKSLDQQMSTVDKDAAESCLRERLYRLGGTADSWQSAVESGYFIGSITEMSFDDYKKEIESNCAELTFRTASWSMFVIFDCHNMQQSVGEFRGPWNSGNIHCVIHTRVRFREDVAVETQGVEVQVIHTGDICQASFSTLLVTLTSSFALLAVSDTITSFVMKKLHPRKDVFKKFIRTDIRASALGVDSFRGGVSVWPEQNNESNDDAVELVPQPPVGPGVSPRPPRPAQSQSQPSDDGDARSESA